MSSTIQKEYILVKVQNPTIHNTYDEGRYTTFEVNLQTNSLSFASKHSVVQRRYSDFQWLRKALARTTDVKPPSLPFGRLFGTFSEEFLKERQRVLTKFLQEIVRETLFLSNSALHLFLQTDLTRKEMDTMLKDIRRRGSMDCIARAIKQFGAQHPSISTTISEASSVNSIDTDSIDESNVLESKSVPVLNRDHWARSSGSLGNGQWSSGSFGQGHLHLNLNSGSFATNDAHRTRGNSLLREDACDGLTDDWVLINQTSTPSPRVRGTDSLDDIDSAAFTNVTWEIGEIEESRENSPQQSPNWNKFRMDKFIQSQSGPIAMPDKHNLSVPAQFKPQSLESAISFHDRKHKKLRNCRHTLKIREMVDMRRTVSETNIPHHIHRPKQRYSLVSQKSTATSDTSSSHSDTSSDNSENELKKSDNSASGVINTASPEVPASAEEKQEESSKTQIQLPAVNICEAINVKTNETSKESNITVECAMDKSQECKCEHAVETVELPHDKEDQSQEFKTAQTAAQAVESSEDKEDQVEAVESSVEKDDLATALTKNETAIPKQKLDKENKSEAIKEKTDDKNSPSDKHQTTSESELLTTESNFTTKSTKTCEKGNTDGLVSLCNNSVTLSPSNVKLDENLNRSMSLETVTSNYEAKTHKKTRSVSSVDNSVICHSFDSGIGSGEFSNSMQQ